MQDVSIKTKQAEIQTIGMNGSDTRIGNALGNGNVGEVSNHCTTPEEDKKTFRQNDIRDIATGYNVSVNDIHNFIQKALGYSVDEFYSLSDDEYDNITTITIMTILDLLNRNKSNLSNKERLEKIAEDFNHMLQNGNTVEEATNFFEHYEECGLFQILKMEFPAELKQYKNANEVPQNVLENCIQKFFEQVDGQKSNRNIGDTLTIFKNLLERTSDADYKAIMSAFVKVSPKENEIFAALLSMIGKFKDPAEFENFIQKDLPKFCAKYGLDLDKTQQILRNIAKTAKEIGLDSKDLLLKLVAQLQPDNIYNRIEEKQKNGEELIQDEVEYVAKYKEKKRIDAKKNNGEQLTTEEKKFLAENEQKEKQMCSAAVAAFAGENPEQLKEYIEIAKQYGISQDDIIQQIIEYSKKFDDYKIDTSIVDEATGGAYSQALAQTQTAEAENSGHTGYSENGIGLSQRVSEEAYTQSYENLPGLRAQVIEEKDEAITVEKKTQNDCPTKSQLLKDVKAFNLALAAHKIKIEDAGKDFGNAVQSIQDKVLAFLKRQNNKNRLDFINSWHNAQLADASAQEFHFNKKQIEELNVSIGRKQVMKNDYEQTHKNEEKEAV